LNAAVAEGRHPVLIFSPGYTGTFTDSTFLFEDLASRGYILVSVAEPYESTAIEFSDGRLIKSVFGSYLRESTLRGDQRSLKLARSVRLADLRFVIDEVPRLNRAGGLLTGKMDLSRVGIMGHSLGAEVALSTLQRDPRLRAGILLDAPIFSEDASGTAKAVLVVTAGRERWSEQECRLWSSLRGARLAVNLRGADHLAPTDAVWFFKVLGFTQPGTLGAEKTVALLRSLVAGFFDSNLRGVTDKTLVNPIVSESEGALLITGERALCHQPLAAAQEEFP
jgi:dienelactone hydrolase